MKKVERIGISLDKKLLSEFDDLICSKGYANRSEAIRDLIRQELSKEKLSNPKTKAVAAVYVIYNHHSAKLMQKITALQHSHLLESICSMHIHLDACDCMEVIILKGMVDSINKMAENLLSQKGVKLGRVNLISTESD